jgi:DNA-binding IclR family transcriptional regulator
MATRKSRPDDGKPVATETDSEASDGGVKGLSKGLEILEYLVKVGAEKGVTEIADHFDLTKARAFRLLQTLVDCGYVVQDVGTSRYAPSIRLFALGQALGERFDFAGAVKSEATQLWESLGHTVVIATVFQDKLLILEVLRGRTPISVGLRTGVLLDLPSSAQGRIALAFGSADLRQRVLKDRIVGHTAKTITARSKLDDELRRVRMQGWSSTPDQLVIGMNAVGAPVFQHDGTLAGTLGVCGLTQFVSHPPTPQLIEQLTTACWRASRKLGWSGKIVASV